jgi:TetR/AcrR family transcriptional regulator, transcriptional repressor for nem operon
VARKIKSTPKTPDETRMKILFAAFEEFYRNGFQGGSVNRIGKNAGITKGALFHHFAGKQELGYAVVDEVIGPLLLQRWLAPLERADDPLEAMKGAFRRYTNEDISSGYFVQGCPLNNLAQEMSPLDNGFQSRIDALYAGWRKRYAEALEAGIKSGKVRTNIKPANAAALIVAGQMGIYGTAKSSQDKQLMLDAAEAICDYLDSLKADR